MKKRILTTLFATLLSGTASAAGYIVEAGLVNIDEVTGGELGLGSRHEAGNFVLRPQVGLFFYPGDENTRYRSQTQKNGTEICRDMNNGQYSNKANCGSNTEAAGFVKLEATYRFNGLELGGGARYGKTDAGTMKTRGYVTFSKYMSPALSWKLNAGQRFAALGLALHF